jgi:ribosome biogenesis protein MAK21
MSQHFHPSVKVFATTILEGETIKYTGDPLDDFSLMNFLHRFVFKNPKAVKSQRHRSVMRPKRDTINANQESDPDQSFLVKFFAQKQKGQTNKPEKRKRAEDEEDEEDEDGAFSDDDALKQFAGGNSDSEDDGGEDSKAVAKGMSFGSDDDEVEMDDDGNVAKVADSFDYDDEEMEFPDEGSEVEDEPSEAQLESLLLQNMSDSEAEDDDDEPSHSKKNQRAKNKKSQDDGSGKSKRKGKGKKGLFHFPHNFCSNHSFIVILAVGLKSVEMFINHIICLLCANFISLLVDA